MTDTEIIKQKIDIVDLISESVVLKKTGANFKGLCPFHNEKTSSFVVSQERQIWHCFGGCQDGGDIFKFVMKQENCDFPEALKLLAKRAGVTLSNQFDTQASDLREKIYKINKLAADYYSYILTSHKIGKDALEYLQNRQISDSSIKLFSLGYAPSSWDSLINFFVKKKYSLTDLDQAGLVSKSSSGKFFDRFRGRLMFTLKDQHGNVVGFAGRTLDPNAKEAKYINTAETAVYVKGNVLYGLEVNKEEIKKQNAAVVVEGEIDLIQSYQSGVRNIVAIKGSALTEGQVQLLKRYTQNLLLALDSDFAGNQAAHRGILIADSAGLDIKVISFSEAKDPDELIKKDPGLWRKAVDSAVPFYDYIISSALSKFDPASATGAKQIVTDTAKFLSPIENLVVKSHYLKKLASKLDVQVETLETQLDKEYRKQQLSLGPSLSIPSPTPVKENRPRQEILGEYLLSLLLQSGRPADYLVLISQRTLDEDFSTPPLKVIYNRLRDFTQTVPLFDLKSFANSFEPEYLATLDRLCLIDLSVDPKDDEAVLSEVSKTSWELRELSLRNQLKDISLKLKSATDENTDNFQTEFQKISEKLSKLTEEKQLISQTNSASI